jgi:hypothetical protein
VETAVYSVTGKVPLDVSSRLLDNQPLDENLYIKYPVGGIYVRVRLGSVKFTWYLLSQQQCWHERDSSVSCFYHAMAYRILN